MSMTDERLEEIRWAAYRDPIIRELLVEVDELRKLLDERKPLLDEIQAILCRCVTLTPMVPPARVKRLELMEEELEDYRQERNLIE